MGKSDARVARLKKQFNVMSSKLDRARARLAEKENPTIAVPISTLAPEPFELVGSIFAVIQESKDGFTASFLDANLGASGETKVEALEGLKDRIVTTFERLEGKTDDQLGPGPLRQKRVLTSLIRRR